MDIKRVLMLSVFSLAAMLGGFFWLKPPTKTNHIQTVSTALPTPAQVQPNLVARVEQTAQVAPVKVQYVDVVEPQVRVVRSAHTEHEQGEGYEATDD